jgi:hypothetical protein
VRRSAILLSLLAALSGTPLRQAEAADDLSRSLAELFQPNVIEPVDGGVGDDSGVATLEAPGQAGVEVDRSPGSEPVLPLCPAPPLVPALSPNGSRPLRQPEPWPLSSTRQRHAWLQVFLF